MNPPSSAVLEAPPATDEITHVGSEPTPTIKRRSPTPTTSAPAPETPRRRSGVWSFLKFMFALVVLGAIVVAAVVAWPAIRDRVFEQVDANSAEIATLDARLADADRTIADLQASVAALDERQAAVPTRLDDLERQFGDLATELSDQDATLAEIDGRATEIAAIIAGVDEHLADVDAAASARAAALGNQLEVSRVIDLTARARLFLYQANYGLAIDDLVVAKAILDAIDPTSGGITSEIRDAASARLALSLASLPDRPVLAADDLNVAWQLLVDDTADPAVASLPPVPPLASEQPAAVDTDVVAPVDVVAPAGDGTPAADEATTGDATADG